MALQFDGTNDQVDHGDIAALDGVDALTLLWWMRYTTDESLSGFLNKGPFNAETFLVRRSGAVTGLHFGSESSSGTGAYTAAGTLATGAWAHWACVYKGAGAANGDKIKIYKDGINQSLTYVGTMPATLASTAASLLVATNSFGYQACELAHLKIYTAELLAAEIVQELHRRRPCRTADLQVWAP
jgi:hypothetical protein